MSAFHCRLFINMASSLPQNFHFLSGAESSFICAFLTMACLLEFEFFFFFFPKLLSVVT